MDTKGLQRAALDFVDDCSEKYDLNLSIGDQLAAASDIAQRLTGGGATANTSSPLPHELPESHPCYAPLTEPAPPPEPGDPGDPE